MEKLIAFIVVLLIANQCKQFCRVFELHAPPNIPTKATTGTWKSGYQCYGDCRIDQQEDCNPGCWCQRFWSGTVQGICLSNG
ncbi:hypothetical protein Leryth_002398 [Lithospermum erythrorhizon]|nr:hypothetical protein Leryth_002398 [Lithospermum erythrorhizon]